MSEATWWEPGRTVISVPDTRLNKLLVRYPYRYATVGEYAQGSGMAVDEVVTALGPYLDSGTLGLEVVGGEIFILTAPGGRPLPAHIAEVAPNLWEALRDGTSLDAAHEAWSVCRELEKVGWKVITDPGQINAQLTPMPVMPKLALNIGSSDVPVVCYPTPASLASETGVLGELERAGARAVAVVCRGGALDSVVTAVRRWIMARLATTTSMTVLILEEPRLAPVVLSAADGAVAPKSVNRTTLETLNWADPS